MTALSEGMLLYAVVDSGRDRGPCSITGVRGAPIETIPCRDLAAAASPVDLERFGRDGPESLRADLLRHQEVNVALLGRCRAVAPMRFGLTAQSREHAAEVLETAYVHLRALLNRLAGKIEVHVQVFWDLPAILKDLAGRDEHVARAWRSPSADPDPSDLGRRLFEAAQAKRKELSRAFHAKLAPCAVDFADGRAPAESIEGREPIFARSYLVERDRERQFDAVVGELGATQDSSLTFEIIGPLPPYSFAHVELNRGNFDVVDQARKSLLLPERASLDEVKAAYRRLAFTLHPDRNPEDPAALDRFRAATRACEILEAYCRGLPASSGAGDYSFAQLDVEAVFVAKDRSSCRE